MTNTTISYLQDGLEFTASFDAMRAFHGAEAGGLATTLKALQRAWPLLDEGRLPERKEVFCTTAFVGVGGRDVIELVTRGVTEGRYSVDKDAGRGIEESPGGRYYFRFEYRNTVVEVAMLPGHVRPEFIQLARKKERTEKEEASLVEMKREMNERLAVLPAEKVFDAKVSRL